MTGDQSRFRPANLAITAEINRRAGSFRMRSLPLAEAIETARREVTNELLNGELKFVGEDSWLHLEKA